MRIRDMFFLKIHASRYRQRKIMIEKNVVRIETLYSIGTGFMYPCKIRGGKNNSFIIITNSHILEDINENDEELMSKIYLVFYDDFGELVDKKYILSMKLCNKEWNSEVDKDIAAIFIELEDTIILSLETYVYTKKLDNREHLYMEGYIGVLYEDEICQRIQLEGIEKTIFPENKFMGVYQIADDYHWYNNYQDHKLLEGISGSPVYVNKDKHSMIVGLNQSVSNIDKGENPFKLVYYLKFEYIIEYLRKVKCIIFYKKTEFTYELEWVYRCNNNNKNELKFLLMGSSGAGKSSFAKDFAFHAEQLRSTNDGQTTRTDIVYKYSLFEKESAANVRFEGKNDFIKKMIGLVGTYPTRMFLAQALDLIIDSVEDERKFMIHLYHLFELIEKKEKIRKFPYILEEIRDILYEERIGNEDCIECYEKVLDIVVDRIPFYMVKCLLDDNWICSFLEKNEKSLFPELKLNYELHYSKDQILELIDKYKKMEGYNFDNFQTDLLDIVFISMDRRPEGYDHFMHKTIQERLNIQEFVNRYINSLLYCKGFFDITEFRFLQQNEIFIDMIRKERIFVFYEKNESENQKRVTRFDFGFSKSMKEIYRKTYDVLMERIKEKYMISDNSIRFKLCEMNEEQIRLLQKCLQVTSDGSLTGIINDVEIRDMVSNEYASILRDLDIDQITMIDTCGLDHITIKSERALLDNLNKNYFKYVNKWSNEKIESRNQAFLDEMGVLYIKKLDSGKPDELRMIIPCVRKEVPKAPIYCIFSGIDIFYRTDEEINNINWKKENERCPKAVRYILEEGEEELIPDKNEKSLDRNIYYVLRNNLIPYCGRKELVHNKFSYYKNNTFYIRKLLSSVAMKEYSSLEIIDLEKIKCVDDEIKLLLTSIFDLASLKSYKFRWNTVRADAESFKKNKMGYCNTYRHKFSQLFHLSYGSAIERNGYKLAEKFAPADSAVMSVLYNMEQDFLGVNSNLELINIKDGDKNEFRKILEEMYKNYDYNPFDEKFKDNDFKSNRNVIFDDIFDLKKGLQKPSPKGGTFLDNFAVYFKVVFERQIKKDNMIKADYLLKINPNFSVALEEIKREFSEKYFENNSDDMFNKIMRYHFGKDED